jgi:hypothetical protein
MITRRNLFKFTASSLIIGTAPAAAFAPSFQMLDTVDWAAPVNGQWKPFLNGRLGCCLEAACANAVLAWSTINGHPIVIKDEAVERFYENAAGYVHGDPKTDQGSEPYTLFHYWKETGWAFDSKVNRLIDYADVGSNRCIVKKSIYHYGGIICCINIPVECFDDNNYTLNRKLTKTKLVDHAVYVAGYNANYVTFVNHGVLSMMSWEFFEKYTYNAFIILNPLWFKDGYSPTGHKYDFLINEVKTLDVDRKNETSAFDLDLK